MFICGLGVIDWRKKTRGQKSRDTVPLSTPDTGRPGKLIVCFIFVGSFLNNPALMNMASSMLQDPNMQNM
jgi:hypothetical protein